MTNSFEKPSNGLKNKNIVISNVLTRSAQGLTLVEKRILMAALAQMGGIFKPVKISAVDYADTYDIDLKNAYSQIKTASQNFRSRYITYSEEYRNGNHKNWEVNWLSAIAYEDQMGFVELEFNPKLFPHLIDIQNQFTKYQLKQTAALRSVYSWRLLELLEQMKNSKTNKGWLSISIDDFWHAMEATTTHRKNFNQTKTKIIEPAIKELTEKDGWLISWEAIKSGRKVATIKFTYQRNPQASLFSPETELIEEKNLEPSFSEKYGVDYPEREVPVITFSEEYIKNF